MLLCYELKLESSILIGSFPDFLLPLILKHFSNPLVWVLRSLALSVSLVWREQFLLAGGGNPVNTGFLHL